MTVSERVRSIIFAFDSRDSRREDIRALADEVEHMETTIEYGKILAEAVGEVLDGAFVPMPRASLSEDERARIAADGLEACWSEFMEAAGAVGKP